MSGIDAPAAILAAFCATLLPGDDVFPPAASLQMLPLILERLRFGGKTYLAELAVAAERLPDLSPAARLEAVACIEASRPVLFEAVCKIVYLTYYEQPAVIAAIRRLGFVYNDAPLPAGYPVEPFTPAIDAPTHKRGRWVPTEAVERVELSGLAHLQEATR